MVRSAVRAGFLGVCAALCAGAARAQDAPAPVGWDALVADFAAAHDAAETACARSLRAAIRPPAGEAPKPFRVQLKLRFGNVATLKITQSSGSVEIDKAALDAVADGVRQARCEALDEITIDIPFR